MSKKKTSSKPKSALQEAVQKALQVTWELKGKLKCLQIAYLKIGALLVQVREENMFSSLKHPTIEDYAQKRLKLGRASLYRYLQVYDWAREFHPKWIQPKPEGFIPYFTDAIDLMWIEKTLKAGGLDASVRKELEALRVKAATGDLKTGELDKWRNKGRRLPDALKKFLSKVRLLRRRSSDINNMPPEALKLMDELITIIDKAVDDERGT